MVPDRWQAQCQNAQGDRSAQATARPTAIYPVRLILGVGEHKDGFLKSTYCENQDLLQWPEEPFFGSDLQCLWLFLSFILLLACGLVVRRRSVGFDSHKGRRDTHHLARGWRYRKKSATAHRHRSSLQVYVEIFNCLYLFI